MTEDPIAVVVEVSRGQHLRQSITVAVPAETRLADLRAFVAERLGEPIGRLEMFAEVAAEFFGVPARTEEAR